MADNILIRRAVEPDVPAMMALVLELATFEKAPEAVTVTFAEFTEAGFGAQSVWQAFLAECRDTGKIVGMALYYIRFSTWKGKMLYLEDIIINKEFRGQGIGGRLMECLEGEAHDLKLKGMCWQVLDWNEAAIRFYQKYPDTKFSNEWVNVVRSL